MRVGDTIVRGSEIQLIEMNLSRLCIVSYRIAVLHTYDVVSFCSDSESADGRQILRFDVTAASSTCDRHTR